MAGDWTHMFFHWQTYALALCGLGSVFLAQNAFHAGPIAASQTALVLVDPLASLAIGIGLFGDNLRTSGAYGPLEALSLLVMFLGAAYIAQSPLISGMKGDDQQYTEMLSLRSRSKRLADAVHDQIPEDVLARLADASTAPPPHEGRRRPGPDHPDGSAVTQPAVRRGRGVGARSGPSRPAGFAAR